ncbi:Flp family type IVb pilin [Phenylobacterium sp.]|jgi:pilus assembly protein Flp/PilA|uniref:Flp family type IVb pilin n=1 Tax=Phenylobacterium sp. TaxID=1871053 RepID=UPI002E32DA6F|nr:Flp family type IVb pilin [Phenylobacterium sp.]HEX3366493.1 Flp family type IVb pilin [Phenylobacterium sp.]
MLGLGQRLLADRSGATAIEYALIASLIAIVILGAVGALGTQLIATYNSVTAAIPG